MIFKLKVFRKAHEQTVKDLYIEDGINSISLYSAVSFCPILAAYWFCRELDRDNIELTKRIESIKIFYGIEEVIEE